MTSVQLGTGVVRVIACAVIVFIVSACSPAYEWRDIEPDQAPMILAVPGKTAKLSRSMTLNGLDVTMTMIGARVESNRFTAAWVDLPAPDGEPLAPGQNSADAEQALNAMRIGMLHNIGLKQAKTTEVFVPLVDASSEPSGRVSATQVSVIGQNNGNKIEMRAIFARFGQRLFQFVVMGPSLREEHVQPFLDGARIRVP